MLRRALFCSLSLLIGALALTLAEPARAQPRRIFGSEDAPPQSGPRVTMRLDYTRGPGAEACPDQEAFVAAVALRMKGHDPFTPNAETRAVLSLRAGAGRSFTGTIEIDTQATSRWARSIGPDVDCRALVDALALTLAAHVMEMPRAPESPIAPPSSPPPFAPIAPSGPEQPAPRVEPSMRPAFRATIGAGPMFGAGVTPVAASIGVEAGARFGPFSIAARARVAPPFEGDVPSGARAAMGLYTGAVVPCGHVWYAVFCVMGELGAVRITTSAPTPNAATGLWAGVGARAGVELPMGKTPLFVRVVGDALLVLRRPEVVIDGVTRFTAPPVTGGLEAGAGVTF